MTPTILSGHRTFISSLRGRKETSHSFLKRKEMATPYYSIPTASRVQSLYQQLSQEDSSILSSCSFWVKKASSVLSSYLFSTYRYQVPELSPPIFLQVAKLPDPPFYTKALPRRFYSKSAILEENYAPSCLLEEKEEDPSIVIDAGSVKKYLEFNFPMRGVLRQEPNGHIYLSVTPPPQFLENLFPFLSSSEDLSNYISPTLGLYSSIITPKERGRFPPLSMEMELGKEFSFRILSLYQADIHSDPEIEKAWYIEIECPELSLLRERNLLPSKIEGHSFHITLLMKKQSAFHKKLPLCRLNVSCFAA